MGHVTEESTNADLSIWLFGEFRVAVDGHPVEAAAWRRSKARSVVKLLALAPGHRLHREQLMDWLWPNLDPDAASANLRKAIHFARGALGSDAVRVTSEIVRLEAAALWVDVDAFEAAAHAGDIDGALGLYTDDLLLEDRFEPWCERRRDQLRTIAAELLLDHSHELEREDAHRQAQEALEQLLVLDPLSEEGHCGLIRLHALAGRRHEAMRWFRQLEDRLSVELGVAPGEEACRLRDEILAGDLGADAPLRAVASGSDELQSVRLAEERKLVTVVVVEVGAGRAMPDDRSRTGMLAANPELIRSHLDEAVTTVASILQRWGARTERQIGGMVVAVFGVPSAGERDAERALHAALEVARRASVRVRVGLDTGVVVAPTSLEAGLDGLAGEAVEVAGRLHELAGAGTVLASERTCRAAREAFELGDRLELLLAEGDAPVWAHRVLASCAGRRPRPRMAMVGRSAQLDAVLGVFGDVVASGRPQLLTVLGSAGIGKSRLVTEVLAAVDARWPSAGVHCGRCASFGGSVADWALAGILCEICGVTPGEPSATDGARLRSRLGALLAPLGLPERDVTLTVATLAASAGFDVADLHGGSFRPDVVADELGRAWCRFAAGLAHDRPALLVIEDGHWADDLLLELLERMVARVARPLLVLVTARPELFDVHQGFSARSPAASVISLPPLGPGSSQELFERLAVERGLDISGADVLDRAEGNPYFIEELVIHLAERESSTLPDTLYSLLAARVDGLAFLEKRVLQEASVIGRTFSGDMVAGQLPGEAVRASLADLERRGLIAGNPAATPGSLEEYSFKHALLRDVAYASVPSARRVEAHLAAAVWFEELSSDRDGLVELMALHYAAATEELAGADADRFEPVRRRAVAALLEAGTATRGRLAIRKAVELHQHALDLATTDEERLRAFEELGDDDHAGYRGDASQGSYEQALAIARGKSDCTVERSRLCRKLALLMAMNPGSFGESPDPVVVEQLISEGLATAVDAVSRAQLLVATGATVRLWSGSEPFGAGTRPDPMPIEARISAVEEALRIGEDYGRDDLVDSAVNTLVILRGLAGDYPGTLSLVDRAVARGNKAASTLAQADVLRTAAVHLIEMSARYDDALDLAQRAYALTRDDAGPHQLMHVTYPLLAALFHLGRWHEIDELLDQHVTAFGAAPAVHCHFVLDGPIIGAIVKLRQGDTGEADRLNGLTSRATVGSRSASAWQSFYAAVSGDADTALALSADKARQGRTRGPQHQLALLEANVTLADWDAVRAMLPRSRQAIAGNKLLGPWCDRAEGLAAAAEGNQRHAEQTMSSAIQTFDELGVRFEAARTREQLANLCPPTVANGLLRQALSQYEQLGATPSAQRVRTILQTNMPKQHRSLS